MSDQVTAMSENPLSVERRGAVALLTLNRPDHANVLNIPMARALLDTAIGLERDASVRAVVLTGAGKHFCFGGDLRGMMAEGGAVDGYLRELTSYLHTALAHFVRMDAPVVAAVNGTAAGGGVGIVCAADLAVCGASSKFSLAYTGVALTPDCSTSFFLPRLVGQRRALELILTNRALTAQEALEWGLVNQVVADAEVVNAALQLAERLAGGPRRAFGKSKRLLLGAAGALEAQLALESQTIARQAASGEGQEGIKAFLDKRKPRFL
ncbi:MAG: enoyl-CoA hydratase-related protein [Steroidobacteraceae bacterium]|nr:enoyl-CoA hydratase-related protein [Steroidobacteraceae bacterium]MDW8259215.1 enoyl-CoA hydratase-related protein [Gammaproteobacteria bacterium]